MITDQQYKDAVLQKTEADKIIKEYFEQKDKSFEERWKRFDRNIEFFKDEDLIYSAFVCCKKCGSGMAYPKDCGPFHQWTCSNVLKGIGTDNGHEILPFSMYDVLSENQPSAYGATTRKK